MSALFILLLFHSHSPGVRWAGSSFNALVLLILMCVLSIRGCGLLCSSTLASSFTFSQPPGVFIMTGYSSTDLLTDHKYYSLTEYVKSSIISVSKLMLVVKLEP